MSKLKQRGDSHNASGQCKRVLATLAILWHYDERKGQERTECRLRAAKACFELTAHFERISNIRLRRDNRRFRIRGLVLRNRILAHVVSLLLISLSLSSAVAGTIQPGKKRRSSFDTVVKFTSRPPIAQNGHKVRVYGRHVTF